MLQNFYFKSLFQSLSGMMVGPIASMISTPFELVKTQMQVNKKAAAGASYNNSSLKTAVFIARNYGMRGLYNGHAVNTCREMVFLSTYFSIYEEFRTFLLQFFPSYVGIPLSGGLAGAIGWFVSFPLDCVKGNIQGSDLKNLQNRASALEVTRRLLRTKGIVGLYSGLVPSITRAFIVSSSRFTAYEATLWALN